MGDKICHFKPRKMGGAGRGIEILVSHSTEGRYVAWKRGFLEGYKAPTRA